MQSDIPLPYIGSDNLKEIIQPFIARISVNLWGKYLLKEWWIQVTNKAIPPVDKEMPKSLNFYQRNEREDPALRQVFNGGHCAFSLFKDCYLIEMEIWCTVWVGQWPLPKEKLVCLQVLVEEQLKVRHIKPHTSPWNTPVFVIPKKLGKWKLPQEILIHVFILQVLFSAQIPLSNCSWIELANDCYCS